MAGNSNSMHSKKGTNYKDGSLASAETRRKPRFGGEYVFLSDFISLYTMDYME